MRGAMAVAFAHDSPGNPTGDWDVDGLDHQVFFLGASSI